MFKQKLFSKVHITKNQKMHLSKSKSQRIISIYSVNTITNGIKTYFQIYDEIGGKKKIEFSLDVLSSIHKKFINEGKATFIFKKKIGMRHQKSTYSSNMMLNALEEDFEIFNVFLYDTVPVNLKNFVGKIIEYIKKRNLEGKSGVQEKNLGDQRAREIEQRFRRNLGRNKGFRRNSSLGRGYALKSNLGTKRSVRESEVDLRDEIRKKNLKMKDGVEHGFGKNVGANECEIEQGIGKNLQINVSLKKNRFLKKSLKDDGFEIKGKFGRNLRGFRSRKDIFEEKVFKQNNKRNLREMMKSFGGVKKVKNIKVKYISKLRESLTEDGFRIKKIFFLVFFASEFLEKAEKKNLMKLNKYIKNKMDLKREKLIISYKYPPLNIIIRLINRFKNLKSLKFSKDVNFRFSNNFFSKVKLKKLINLDISKCLNINENIINKFFLICPNLSNLKLPYNIIKYSNLINMTKYMINSLQSIKFKNNKNLHSESELNQYLNLLVKFFSNNRKVTKLQFYNLNAKIFLEFEKKNIFLGNLTNLKIKYLIVNKESLLAFFKFLKRMPKLKSLKIGNIYNKEGNYIEIGENIDLKNLLVSFLIDCKKLEKMNFGNFFDIEFFGILMENFKLNKIFLKKIKLMGSFMDDEFIREILKNNNFVEILQIEKCDKIVGEGFELLNKDFENLKSIRVFLDEFSINFLKKILKARKVPNCKIIRILK